MIVRFRFTSHRLHQLTTEAAADHAVEQEIGGGIQVLQHVGQVPGHVNGQAVVIPVEVPVVVLGSQDAVRDKARKAEENKGCRDGAQQQDGPLQQTPSASSVNDTPLLLGEEVAYATKVKSNKEIEDDDQHDGDSP